MSYDYNTLVSQISEFRRGAAHATSDETKLEQLQCAVDTMETLSSHCPMTPLLWMQYSADTAELLNTLSQDEASSLETRLQLLEVALLEFPGSAILQLHYLQLLCKDPKNADKVGEALLSAQVNVGMGSHASEGALVAQIYQLAIDFYATRDVDTALRQFVAMARIPMQSYNQSISSDLDDFCTKHSISQSKKSEISQLVDEERRRQAKLFGKLEACEDEVDAAMHAEGILSRHHVNLEKLQWTKILQSDDKTFWMGFGGPQSAKAFERYASTCFRYRMPRHEEENTNEEDESKQAETIIRNLALCVFERGVAECPAAESLWLAYVKHLNYMVVSDATFVSRLQSVMDRAVRNCPYSFQLFRQKLLLQGTLADLEVSVLDVDQLTKIVHDAINAKFLPSKESCLELFMTAIQVLRRRILKILAQVPVDEKVLAYDESEDVSSAGTKVELSDSAMQEVQDLVDDSRDVYEEVDSYLRKHHVKWSEGRAKLWKDHATSETNLLSQVGGAELSGSEKAACQSRFKETVRCFEKLTKVHQPAHPDSFMEFIQALQTQYPVLTPASVVGKFRKTRFLFQKALRSVGKPKHTTEGWEVQDRDYESALRNLCHQYLTMERFFGSDQSLEQASKTVHKKLSHFVPSQPQTYMEPTGETLSEPASTVGIDSAPEPLQSPMEVDDTAIDSSDKKRAAEDDGEGLPPTKKAKSSDDANAGEQKVQPKRHKVKVGNLEYPAHPFTVRVSKLSPDTEDMELVDIFRPKCGPIVHAKIIREKHHQDKGKSKGWGLIQFESTDSVEKALELSGVIGIHEKLVAVSRSHIPAASLVPPGRHRVVPKGEGKSSKQNQKRKEQRSHQHTNPEESTETTSKPVQPPKAPESASASGNLGVLAFKPRGVQRNRKAKVQLNQTET